jgi:DNA mismatch repair protein MutS2
VQLRAVTEELRKEKKIETVRKAQTVIREWKEKGKAEDDPVVRAMISRTAPVFPGTALVQGQKVFLASIHKEGEVASVPAPEDRDVEVRFGGMKIRVPLEQVRFFPAAPPRLPEGRSPKASRRGEDAPPALHLQTPENTLDLRGMYVDEALPEVDAFLDRLSLAQAPHAFIIHGHGTGALKAAVRSHLRASPYAKRAFAAPREQGGDGVTIVLLQ